MEEHYNYVAADLDVSHVLNVGRERKETQVQLKS